MEEQKKSRKALLIGIIAAVVILAGILALVLTQCMGGTNPDATTDPTGTTGQATAQTYALYWNVDRAKYQAYENQEGEAVGTTGRKPNEDGYYSVLFAHEGEQVELLVETRRLVNIIDGYDLMGLVFNEDGLVVDVQRLDDMPLEQIAWQFYVQSMGGNKVKFNSSLDAVGMEVMVELDDDVKIYDVSGVSGYVGTESFLQKNDRVMVVANELGKITHIFVYGREGIMTTVTKYCKHCKEDVKWENWYKKDTLPTTVGHYYLENDVTLKGQQQIQEDNHVCLDLNGKTVTGKKNARMYSNFFPSSSLALMDNSEEKTGKMVAMGDKMDQGNVLWCRYGYMDIYDVTLDASAVNADVHGVAVQVSSRTRFTLHSGKIIGGKAIKSAEGKYGSGGAVHVQGTFIMEDGEIIGGQSVATGGNVYINGEGIFTMNGGKITDGICYGANGGNVSIAKNATFIFNDGIISGGTATVAANGSAGGGGNFYINGKLEMNGGVITGGRQIKQDGTRNDHYSARNVFLVNGTLNMYGGHIFGYANCVDTSATDKNQARVYLSGLAHIDGAAEGDPNLFMNPRTICNVGKLIDGAHISINNTGIFSEETAESNVKYFSSDHEGAGVVWTNKRLAVGKISCLCGANEAEAHAAGCTKELLYWQPITGAFNSVNGGNYYLLSDTVFAGQSGFGKQPSKDAEGNTIVPERISGALDMNGYNVTAPNGRAFLAWGNASVYLCNTRPESGGVIAGAGVAPKVNDKGEEVYNHSTTIMTSGSDSVITMLQGVTLTAVENENSDSAGVLRVSGTFNMYGGKITGGYARTKGGNVEVTGAATFNMYGGEISDGVAGNNGGNVFMAPGAKFNMSGDAKITGGANQTASNGGSIYLNSNAVFTMTDNTLISGGVCGNSGGNVYLNGTLNVLGNAKITGGMGFIENGTRVISAGNVFCVNGTVRVADNATIDGYMHFTDTSATDTKISKLILAGSPTIEGGPGGNNVYLNEFSILEIDGTLADDCKIGLSYGGSGAFSTETVPENADNIYNWKSPSIGAFYVNIEGHEDYKKLTFGRIACLCGANEGEEHIGECDGTPLVWTAWTSTSTLPNKAGNWFLTDCDGTQDGVVNFAAQAQNPSAETINIDLNGLTAVANGGRAISLVNNYATTVNVTDTSVGHEGTIKLSEAEKAEQGQGIWSRYTHQTINIYRATLDASARTCTSTAGGTAIYAGGPVNLYNATVIGGKAANGAAIYLNAAAADLTMVNAVVTGAEVSGNGGAIYSNSANIAITDSTVTGANAVNGGAIYASAGAITIDGENTLITAKDKAVVNGGAIYGQSGATVVTMNAGKIVGGTASGNGGAVFLNAGADLIMTDGIIENGKAASGGNVFIEHSSACVLDISGGYIQNGEATGSGSNIWANAGSFKLSGTAKILNGDVFLFRNLTLGEWEGNGKDEQDNIIPLAVVLRGAPGKLAVAESAEIDLTVYENYFSTQEGYTITNESDGLWIRGGSGSNPNPPAAAEACLCGANEGEEHIGECDGTALEWNAWPIGGAGGNTTLPSESGNWYLVDGDGTNDGVVTISAWVRPTAAMDIVVDLKGLTVNQTSGRAYDGLKNVALNITITDSSDGHTGNITATNTAKTESGRILWGNYTKQNFTVYRATLDASQVNSASGAIYARGNVSLYNATVKGVASSTGSGCAIYHDKTTGYIVISNSKIYGGNAAGNGGAICTSSPVLITGKDTLITAEGKTATNGGAICAPVGSAEITMEDGEIIGGTVTGNGGAVYIVDGADFLMKGGSIHGGTAVNGGNVFVNHIEECVFDMSGGEIYGGTSNTIGTGQNVWVRAKTFKISGTASIHDGSVFQFCTMTLGQWQGNGQTKMLVRCHDNTYAGGIFANADTGVDISGYVEFFDMGGSYNAVADGTATLRFQAK